GPAEEVAHDAEEDAAGPPADEEDGRGVAAVGRHLLLRRFDARLGLQEFAHGWPAGDVEQLLVHRVEQPAQGANQQNEPVVAGQFAPPGSAVVTFGGGEGDFGVHETSAGKRVRVAASGAALLVYTPPPSDASIYPDLTLSV